MRKRSLAMDGLLLFRNFASLLFWTIPGVLGFVWENIVFGFVVGRELAKRVRDYESGEAAS